MTEGLQNLKLFLMGKYLTIITRASVLVTLIVLFKAFRPTRADMMDFVGNDTSRYEVRSTFFFRKVFIKKTCRGVAMGMMCYIWNEDSTFDYRQYKRN